MDLKQIKSLVPLFINLSIKTKNIRAKCYANTNLFSYFGW